MDLYHDDDQGQAKHVQQLQGRRCSEALRPTFCLEVKSALYFPLFFSFLLVSHGLCTVHYCTVFDNREVPY